MSLGVWTERFDLHDGPLFSPIFEFFSIRYFKAYMNGNGELENRLLGYIDWCSADTISKIEIEKMGKALGLEVGEYKYFWTSPTHGFLRELASDIDVLNMAEVVGPSRVVIVEARLSTPVNTNVNVNEPEIVDADDSDVYDSDYSFGGDEDMENDDIVSLESESFHEEQPDAVVDDEAVESEAAAENGEAVESEADQPLDCPSSDYAGSEQLLSGSDSDNEGLSRPRFPDFDEDNINDPQFEVGMMFSSFQQFKEACRNYVIKNRYVINFKPNNKRRCKAICKKSCPFFMWASLMSKDNSTVQIKTGILTHSCPREHSIRHVNTKWVSKEYLEQFRSDPTWKLEGIMQAVRTNQKIEISKTIAYRAKKRALGIINGDETEQISLLHDYRLELIRTHP
ncbi:uncharacterized protein LOC126661994 [Mercurialis annua]|uniref:uncharacterized protein LOC126661994 n=1 Tax=Mercurialis annua TaxID=3986 RepID=UPI00215F14BA|nr:uncharacterized protein LOC126661994 [Mercurialis annua]